MHVTNIQPQILTTIVVGEKCQILKKFSSHISTCITHWWCRHKNSKLVKFIHCTNDSKFKEKYIQMKPQYNWIGLQQLAHVDSRMRFYSLILSHECNKPIASIFDTCQSETCASKKRKMQVKLDFK